MSSSNVDRLAAAVNDLVEFVRQHEPIIEAIEDEDGNEIMAARFQYLDERQLSQLRKLDTTVWALCGQVGLHLPEVPENNLGIGIKYLGRTGVPIFREPDCRQWAIAPKQRWIESIRSVRDALKVLAPATDHFDDVPSKPALLVPAPVQRRILKALEGKALKADALAKVACGGDRSRLYKKNGLKELRADSLVMHKHGVGYYRPDKRPADGLPLQQSCH
jgi:hypothetical protein